MPDASVWDGAQWVSFYSGAPVAKVSAAAGGAFVDITGQSNPAANVKSIWTGSAWMPLDTFITGPIPVISESPVPKVEAGKTIYAQQLQAGGSNSIDVYICTATNDGGNVTNKFSLPAGLTLIYQNADGDDIQLIAGWRDSTGGAAPEFVTSNTNDVAMQCISLRISNALVSGAVAASVDFVSAKNGAIPQTVGPITPGIPGYLGICTAAFNFGTELLGDIVLTGTDWSVATVTPSGSNFGLGAAMAGVSASGDANLPAATVDITGDGDSIALLMFAIVPQ